MFPPLRRLVLAGLVMLFAAVPGLAQSAATRVPLNILSPSGAYLAGQEAFADLNTAEAAELFRSAAQVNWDNPVLVERAMIASAANGQMTEAAALAQHMLEMDGEHDMARLILGSAALKGRRYGAAAEILGAAGTDSFVGVAATILQAWARIGQGRPDDAYTVVETFARSGLARFLVFHEALMADVAGNRDKAASLIAEAQKAEPFVARILEAYARINANASRFDEASAAIKAFHDEGLSHPLIDLVDQSVQTRTRPGKFAPTVQAGGAELLHGIGAWLASDGNYEVAAVFLQISAYLDPRSDIVAMTIGELLDTVGRHEQANRIYDSIAANSPMRASATVRLAENLDAMGDRKEAIRRLGNIAATNPDNLDAVAALGDLLRYDGQFAAAADAYGRAIEIVGGEHPRDWRFFYVRAIAYERADVWDKAERDFLRALELNPDQPQVLNYLGYSWVDKGLNLEKALGLIEKAVEANPNDGYIVDSLGWAFYKLKRYDEALPVLEEAVRLRPSDPEINDHLGDLYWALGRTLEARFQWRIASDMDTEGNVRKRVADKLENGLAGTSH